MEWEFSWANGGEVAEGNDYVSAIHNLKTSPDNILTGFLVRVRRLRVGMAPREPWGYFDAEYFWKHLKKAVKDVPTEFRKAKKTSKLKQ